MNTNDTITNPNVTSTSLSEELAARLHNAGKKVENQSKARREREVKGSHLLEPMLNQAKEMALSVEDKSGFYKITGAAGKDKAIYLARKGGRVDVSGFAVASDAVIQISEEEAKAKHLGKVRGQINFEKADADVLAVFKSCLEQLNIAVPKPEKKVAPKREKKVEAAPAEGTEEKKTESEDKTETPVEPSAPVA